MATKLWVSDALQALHESLTPIPHELNELDWKARLSDDKDRLAEHLMAFANHANGGYLVFGVSDDGQVLGVGASEAREITAKLTNLAREAMEPPVALDHAVVDHPSGPPILIVRIPEQAIKPVHRRGKSEMETWIRSGGTTRKASRQEVGGLMLNSGSPCWEELRASPLLKLEEVQALLDLDAIAALLQRPLPEDADDLARWLQAEGIAAPEGRGHYITNFGAIAAARKLEDFPNLDRKRIRLVRYRGTNKVEAIDELLGQRGYAVGFEGLVAHLRRVLPHSEVIQQSLRTETTVYPDIALRELIANALIHQDFNISGAGPMVDIYADRITVTNPGSLLPGKKPDRLIGTTPESRNERLAKAFRRYRICEERGTGFQKVVNYDFTGQISSLTHGANSASYHYDSDARRVIKRQGAGGVVYVYGQQGELLGEYDLVTGQALREYLWLGMTPVAMIAKAQGQAQAELFYLHADHIDTPRVATDRQGRTRWNWLAEPFGNQIASSQPTSPLPHVTQNLRFPGQVFDQESGLHYNHHRYYDPRTGRYTQSDPIGLDGGINTYSYVEGDPVSSIDPEGLNGKTGGGGVLPRNYGKDKPLPPPDKLPNDAKQQNKDNIDNRQNEHDAWKCFFTACEAKQSISKATFCSRSLCVTCDGQEFYIDAFSGDASAFDPATTKCKCVQRSFDPKYQGGPPPGLTAPGR